MSRNSEYLEFCRDFAKRNQAEIQANVAKARRLKKLRIDEVSSVNSGAGRGVNVVLLKSDNEGTSMNPIETAIHKLDSNFISACTSMVELAKRNEISAATFDKFIKHAAVAAFPLAKSEGSAMNSFFQTVRGKEMLAVHMRMPTAAEAAKMDEMGLAKIGYVHKNDTDENPDPDPDPDAASAHLSPAYRQLAEMAQAHRGTPEGKGMSAAQAFAHLAVNDQKGRDLMAQDKAWHDMRSRSLIAQGQRIAGMS